MVFSKSLENERELSKLGNNFNTTSEIKSEFQKRFFQIHAEIEKNLNSISGKSPSYKEINFDSIRDTFGDEKDFELLNGNNTLKVHTNKVVGESKLWIEFHSIHEGRLEIEVRKNENGIFD